MMFKWWWLAVIGAGLIALALLTPRAEAQEPKPDTRALLINWGDLWRSSGESMKPAFQDGDLLLVRPSKVKPQVNQVIIYYDYLLAQYVSHRVVEVSEDNQGWYAYVKGDNVANKSWVPVRAVNIYGVATGILRFW